MPLEPLLNISHPCLALSLADNLSQFVTRWAKLMSGLALDAVQLVAVTDKEGRREVDTKRYVRVEKIPGGDIEESSVLRGVMFNKDVTHAKMRRRIEKPRILLLDCTLEYKKGESATSTEISRWASVLSLCSECGGFAGGRL